MCSCKPAVLYYLLAESFMYGLVLAPLIVAIVPPQGFTQRRRFCVKQKTGLQAWTLQFFVRYLLYGASMVNIVEHHETGDACPLWLKLRTLSVHREPRLHGALEDTVHVRAVG